MIKLPEIGKGDSNEFTITDALRRGISHLPEVLDADKQYYESQNILARTQGLQLIYYVQFYRALGGGWQV